ncbi:MAG: peptidylprolyl isomerase [Ruminococcus sp.]|nr:peptidylprolyl isomerase [Ruminococcus sp.]
MFKKISAFLLAMTLTISCLASCDDSKKDKSSKASDSSVAESTPAGLTSEKGSLTIDGKKVDTKDLTICVVDGKEIDFDTFRFYYYTTLATLSNYYGVTEEGLKEKEETYEAFKKEVVNTIIQDAVYEKLAKENNITLDEDDKITIEKAVKNLQSNYQSEEEYKAALSAMYLTEDYYTDMVTTGTLNNKVYTQLFTNGGKYATSQEDFKKIVKDPDEYSRVIHILIPYECQAEITDKETLDSYEESDLSTKLESKKTAFYQQTEDVQKQLKDKAKKLAEDVLKKAESGENFETLVKTYGWDTGMEKSPEGYYINENTSFVKEFKDMAFKLKENEISGLVESDSFGWFIIKRLPVDMDYVNKNIETMINEYDQPRLQKFFSDYSDKIEVVYDEIFDKITVDSIK